MLTPTTLTHYELRADNGGPRITAEELRDLWWGIARASDLASPKDDPLIRSVLTATWNALEILYTREEA